jgi:hypothetical protein
LTGGTGSARPSTRLLRPSIRVTLKYCGRFQLGDSMSSMGPVL